MRLLHTAAKTGASFDDPNLVSYAGLVPAVRLVENVGLEDLVASHVRVAAKVGANPGLKVGSVQRRVYGATKQGAAFGHAKIASKPLLVRGLNALVATVSTPLGRTGRGGRAVAGAATPDPPAAPPAWWPG